MRNHTQPLKTALAGVLIGLASLATSAQVTDSGKQSSRRPAVSLPQNTSVHSQNRLPKKRLGASNTASVSFLPAVPYDSGGFWANSVAIGDINADGNADIVVANCGSSGANGCPSGTVQEVGLLLGNGDGTFQGPLRLDSGGFGGYSIAIADVNRDGNPDLIVTNFCTSSTNCAQGAVGVLLGNGDRTFQTTVSYFSGAATALAVAIADVNGDGNLDLLVANGSGVTGGCFGGCLGVLLGNGDGTFQPAVTYGAGPSVPHSVAVADVNNDGKLDVLVTNQCTTSVTCLTTAGVEVLLGNGDGSFGSAVAYGSGGYDAYSLAVADVNGDGKPDIVVANVCVDPTCRGVVGVLLGNGDGTFRAAATYDSGGYYANSIAVADLNGDGKPDLAVAQSCLNSSCPSGGVGVLVGNGDGTFQTAIAYGSGAEVAWGIAIGDVNADGKPDLVTANESSGYYEGAVGVLLNNTTVGKFTTSTTLTSSLNPSLYGQPVTWTATVTSSGSVVPTGTVKFMWSGYSIGSATLNASGIATLTKSTLNADPYPLVAVYAGDTANLGSTSPVLNQVILQTTSSATIASSLNPSKQGQAVTFTATITSPTVTPTGPVTFMAGKTVLGTGQLSGGKAKFTTSTLAVGSTVITATYYGSSNIAKSSASLTQTVQRK